MCCMHCRSDVCQVTHVDSLPVLIWNAAHPNCLDGRIKIGTYFSALLSFSLSLFLSSSIVLFLLHLSIFSDLSALWLRNLEKSSTVVVSCRKPSPGDGDKLMFVFSHALVCTMPPEVNERWCLIMLTHLSSFIVLRIQWDSRKVQGMAAGQPRRHLYPHVWRKR